MTTREILEKLKRDEISLDEAESFFKKEPFEELGDYAKLDSHREIRSGFPEVVYCSGKTDEHLIHIYEKLYRDNGEIGRASCRERV